MKTPKPNDRVRGIMNNWMIVLFFIVDAFIVYFVIGGLIGRVWGELAKQFPEQPIGDGAFHKNFQTVAIGSVNLGFSVHMAADDDYLHWIPASFLRIFGCKTASIPWSSIQQSPKQPVIQKSMANINFTGQNKQLTVPQWCLEIKNTLEPTKASEVAPK